MRQLFNTKLSCKYTVQGRAVTWVLVSKHSVQVDSVGIQVHTDNIWWWVIKVKVAGVHAHYEWTRSIEDACQREWAQGDIGTLPLEGEDQLKRDKREKQDYSN